MPRSSRLSTTTSSTRSPTPTSSSKRSSRRPTRSGRCSRASTRWPSRTILASNTSSISITLAWRRDHAAGQGARHAFHEPGPADEARRDDPRPGHLRRIDGDRREAVPDAREDAVEAADYPGFIANRILMPMINEAIYAVMEGVGTPDAIDTVMKLGMNHPMGPLALADFIGLDICLAILNVLHEGFGDPKYRPARSCADGRCRAPRKEVGPRFLRLRLTRFTEAQSARRRPLSPQIALSAVSCELSVSTPASCGLDRYRALRRSVSDRAGSRTASEPRIATSATRGQSVCSNRSCAENDVRRSSGRKRCQCEMNQRR